MATKKLSKRGAKKVGSTKKAVSKKKLTGRLRAWPTKLDTPSFFKKWMVVPTILVVAIAGYLVVRLALANNDTGGWYHSFQVDLPRNSATNPNGYYNFDTVMTPLSDGNPDGYFFIQQIFFRDSGQAYAGLQTNAGGYKIAIFSVWDANGVKGPDATGTFGGEGEGYSARLKYSWVVGHGYKVRIAKDTTDSSGTWWRGTVRDQVTGVESWIGSIRVPHNRLIDGAVLGHERYGGSLDDCAAMYNSTVSFTNPMANNDTVSPSSFSNGANRQTCSNYTKMTAIATGFKSQIGTRTSTTILNSTKLTSATTVKYTADSLIASCPTKVAKNNGASVCTLLPNTPTFLLHGIPETPTGRTKFCFVIARGNSEPLIATATVGVDDTFDVGGGPGLIGSSAATIKESGFKDVCVPTQSVLRIKNASNYAKLTVTSGKAVVYNGQFK